MCIRDRVYTVVGAPRVTSAILLPGVPVPAQRPGDVTVGALSLTPGGEMFAVVNEPPKLASGTIALTQSRLELIDGHLRRVPVATVAGGVSRQAMYGDSDVDFLTWTETPSTNLYDQPWTVLVHDRATGATRVLAQSAGGPVPAPPGGTVPFLAGGRVYWAAAQATGDPTRPARTFIESRDVQGSGPVRREVSDAMQPSASGHFLFYVVSSLVNPAMPPGQTAIHRRDLRTGLDV
jgi:hypothetical protein